MPKNSFIVPANIATTQAMEIMASTTPVNQKRKKET